MNSSKHQQNGKISKKKQQQPSNDNQQPPNIDYELKLAKQSHLKRKSEIKPRRDNKNPKKMLKKLENCCCNNLQIIKYILIILAIIGSLFGSILLIIAGDPPFNQGELYQHSDLMRLVYGIHQNLLDVKSATNANSNQKPTTTTSSVFVPALIEKRDIHDHQDKWKEIFHLDMLKDLAKSSRNQLILLKENQFGQFLQKWLPIKRSDFQSNDPILNDLNFYWNNYSTFQVAFITLLLLSNTLLLLTWIFFKLLKNFQKSRQKSNDQIDGDQMDDQKSKISEGKQFINEQIGQVSKQFKQNFRETNMKNRLFWFSLLFQFALIVILLCRPNFFIIVCFLLLSVGCLASTSIRPSKSSAKSHGGIIIDRPPPPTPPPSVRLDIENNGDKRNSIDHSRPSINIDTGDILGGKNGTIKIPTISSGEIQSSGMTPISVKLPEVKLSKHHHQHKKHHRHNRKRSSPPPPLTGERQILSPLIEHSVKNDDPNDQNDHQKQYPDDKNPFEISIKNPIKNIKLKNPLEKLEIKNPFGEISEIITEKNNNVDDNLHVDIEVKNPEIKLPKINNLIKKDDAISSMVVIDKQPESELDPSLSLSASKNPTKSTNNKLLEIKLPKIEPINSSYIVGKNKTMSNFKHLSIAWRRFCRRWYRKNSYSESSSTKSMAKLPDLSPRLRLIFIIVAFIFLAIAAFILILVILTTNGNELEPNDNHGGSSSTSAKLLFRLKQIINNNRTIVIFLSTTFALFQLMAIGAAIFNWSIVLFSYVIITGIFGTIIGIVGIVGIIFTCLLMRHDNHHDHTITITIAIVISFVFIFYLMTILGLRLMDYFRRHIRLPSPKS
ncbi:hypothetical protein DERP_008681 [Dermatophagoides pteronyssinus]|uniref:Uncharacterized protein n=1 Tax=Dermatophagoides pteronyssinus TaxID=6956 RepID=A0ABQ8IVZ2_DERPT|nr:hypothetical protein DERP_008681 [Dermatophagoides pteronyssinus]